QLGRYRIEDADRTAFNDGLQRNGLGRCAVELAEHRFAARVTMRNRRMSDTAGSVCHIHRAPVRETGDGESGDGADRRLDAQGRGRKDAARLREEGGAALDRLQLLAQRPLDIAAVLTVAFVC